MPGKSDEPVGAEGIGIVPVAAGGAEQFTADHAEAAFELTAVPRGVLAHESGDEDEFVAESRGNRAACFHERFEMGLGGLLETKNGFAAITTMRVAAGEKRALGNPHTVFITSDLNFRDGNNHYVKRLAHVEAGVKRHESLLRRALAQSSPNRRPPR